MGSDFCIAFGKDAFHYASIHAPAWGATHNIIVNAMDYFELQSTLPHGERPKPKALASSPLRFNPRSRMGSDGLVIDEIYDGYSFNPRSRMGSDYYTMIQLG